MTSVTEPSLATKPPEVRARRVAGMALTGAGLAYLIAQLVVYEETPAAAPALTPLTGGLYVASGVAVLAGLAILATSEQLTPLTRQLLGIVAGILMPLFVVASIAVIPGVWPLFWVYGIAAVASPLTLRRKVAWRPVANAFSATTAVLCLVLLALGPL